MAVSTPLHEVEVSMKPETGKAVIEGKTAVPFHGFTTLILQRKVQQLSKQWGREPVIVSSELLTQLASAPQDSVENKSQLVSVSMGVGVLGGVFASCVTLLALTSANIIPGIREYGIVAGGIIGLAALAWALMKMKRVKRGERLVETMESLSAFLGK